MHGLYMHCNAEATRYYRCCTRLLPAFHSIQDATSSLIFNAQTCKFMQVFVRARQKLGEILSAFEFFDQQALDLTLKHLEGTRNPLPDTQTPFYLVVETSGSNDVHDSEKLEV